MKNDNLYDMDSVELFERMENLKLDLKKNDAEYKDLFEKSLKKLKKSRMSTQILEVF